MWRFLVLGVVLLTAPPIRAEPTAPRPAEPRPQVTPRYAEAPPRTAPLDYRLTLVAIDGLALATVTTAALLDNDGSAPVAILGASVYAVGPGVVHLAHGQGWRAAASIGMRVGFPAIGVGTAVAIANSCGTHVNDTGETESDFGCPFGGVIIGGAIAVLGIATAVIIDDAMLGKVEPKPEQRRSTWGIAPLVSPRRSAMGVSVIGSF